MALLKVLLTFILTAFCAPGFSQADGGSAPAAKKSLEAYFAGAGVVQDMLSDSENRVIAGLYDAADPADAQTEKPILKELAKVKGVEKTFLAWRGKPGSAKADYDNDPAAFEKKWALLAPCIDAAKLKQLRIDAGIDAPADDNQWYQQFVNYLACKANRAACSSSK